jgi:hypothetical protein
MKPRQKDNEVVVERALALLTSHEPERRSSQEAKAMARPRPPVRRDNTQPPNLPASVRAEAQRILDGAARRVLREQLHGRG